MDKTEKRILKDLTTAVAHSSKHAWDQLKQEIYDHGHQTYYPAQSMFENAAKDSLKLLSDFEQRKLIQLWNNSSPKRDRLTKADIAERNTQMIIEQIVSRARSAAYRTVNW